jgi:hypothetical protein
MENQIHTNEQTMLSETMLYNLRKTAPWMKFFSIISFIGAGILIIISIIILQRAVSMSGVYYGSRYDSMSIAVAAIIYIAISIVMIVMGSYLYKSANGYSQYSITKSSDMLENAFLMQKKYWRTIGIFTIVWLSLMLIALLTFIVDTNSVRIY